MSILIPPLVAGLSSRSRQTSDPLVASWICEATWAQLQAVPFGPLTHPNPIDAAVKLPPAFRVRLFFGEYSPAFAAELAGGAVSMTDRQDGTTWRVPIWWAARLQSARANLLARLADAYDGAIPLIFMGGNGTVYPEPFVRQVGDAATRANLLAAGYTAALDQATYEAELDAWSAFQYTRLGWSLNPWQSVAADGSAAPASTDFTVSMLTEFRRRFGQRAVLQNNSIRTQSIPGYSDLYMAIRAAGGPVSFQTATLSRVGNLAVTIEWAIKQGAHLVELPGGYAQVLSTAARKTYDTELRANAVAS